MGVDKSEEPPDQPDLQRKERLGSKRGTWLEATKTGVDKSVESLQ